MSSETLQPGIYFERSVPPPPAWLALLLNASRGATPRQVSEAVGEVVAMLTGLQEGQLRELSVTRADEAPASIPLHTFDFLLGFGTSFFSPGRGLAAAEKPSHLVSLRRGRSAFPALPWSDHGSDDTDRGEADFFLQFTGATQHAVSRAAVEVVSLVNEQTLPLEPVWSFDGFQRDDGRSWVGFHDGVSNLEPSQRRAAIECRGDPDWNRGGTYLAFLRIDISLNRWRTLTRREQELIIGRNKLTGVPLESIDEDGTPLTMPISPPTDASSWYERDAYFNIADSGNPRIEATHVNRVNQNRASPSTPSAHRIFRQGYEFLGRVSPTGADVGLNFISFQSDLRHLQQVLGLPGWLGDANFGGDSHAGQSADPVFSLAAGGFYAVPPKESPFPGARLFLAQTTMS